MKPLRLEMCAFGPFAGRVELDFAAVAGRPLLLLHGPTGAGKTTILDAMCFALFGETSGDEREGRGMRCDLASIQVETSVTFEFALGERRYRVRRSPEQERPKKRGSGTKKAQHEAALFELSEAEGPRPLGEKPSVVAEKIRALFGFDSKQFRQVVMLPQGQFRDFLLADAPSKEKILQALFGTKLYELITAKLQGESRTLERAYREARNKQQTLLEDRGLSSLAELRERLLELGGELAKAQTLELAASEQHKAAREELRRGQDATRRLLEVEEAGAAHKELLGLDEDMREKRQRCERADRAAELLGAVEEVKRLEKALELARSEADQSVESLSEARSADAEAKGLQSDAEERRPELESVRRRIAELEAREGKAARLGELEALLKAAEEELHGATSTHSDTSISLQQAEEARAEAATQREGALAKAAGEAEAAHALKKAERLLEDRRELARTSAALATAEKTRDVAAARRRAQETKLREESARLDELRRRWQAGQAGLLARALEERAPCPVCGSHEHPAPAIAPPDLPREEDLKELEGQLSELAAALRQESEEAARGEAEVRRQADARRALEERLAEHASAPLDELQRHREQARAVLHETVEARKRGETLRSQLDQLEESHRALKEAHDDAGKALQEATTRASKARAERELTAADLPEELRAVGALAERLRGLAEEEKALASLLEARREQAAGAQEELAKAMERQRGAATARERQHKTLEEARDRLLARREALELADEAVWQAALVEVELRGAWRQELSSYGEMRRSAEDRLAKAEREAAGVGAPDLAQLEVAASAADDESAAASEHRQLLSHKRSDLSALLATLQEEASRGEELEAHFRLVAGLADVAGGRVAPRVSLQRWVLGALLEDVLASATVRLRRMSAGRYSLERAQGSDDGRTAAGLDLEVLDEYSGGRRSVNTLSGGESFLAALALALGLADVVQSHSGGIRLDTLFIDEGFGTLDPEALDRALTVLTQLHAGGRLVGIISHVPELKERIDLRLEVVPSRSGSTARFVTS